MERNLGQKIGTKLMAWRWPLLLLAAAITALTFPLSGGLEFDRSLENMFSADDPLLPPFRKLQRTFGGNAVVLLVYQDDALMDSQGAGIARVRKVSELLQDVPGIEEILSLAFLDDMLKKLAIVKQFTSPRPRSPAPILDQHDPLARSLLKMFRGVTHGTDGKTVAVVCMLKPEAVAVVTRAETIARIRRVAKELPDGLPAGMIAGEPVMVVDGFRFVEEDGNKLGWLSTGLLALVILACFQSFRWALIAVAVVQFTLLITRAILTLLELQLSMVSSMLTALITVIGIATVVHIAVRYRLARSRQLGPTESLQQSINYLAAPVFWTCCTDAVGFGALSLAQVGPVRDFGLMMALGSLLVLLGVVLIVPGAVLLGASKQSPRFVWGRDRLINELGQLVGWVKRRRKWVAGAAVVIGILAVCGLPRLKLETDFTRNFRQDSEIVGAYRFIEDHLGGSGSWDLLVPAPRWMDEKYVNRVQHLQQRLRELRMPDQPGREPRPALTSVVSMVDGLRAWQQQPMSKVLSLQQNAILMQAAMPGFVRAIRGQDPDHPADYYLRIMLRSRERQPAEDKLWLIQEVERISGEEFPAAAAGSDVTGTAEVTGFFVLLTNLIKSLLRDQWICFLVACLGIGLMMAMAFRSVTLAMIALVPNMLPILVVMGGMGWVGVNVNMGAVMIAAVSMGLSIDSTIHYITSFQRECRVGRSVEEALQHSHRTVGFSVVLATLALVVGFSVLCTSQFVPIIYFGVLVGLSMLGGLLGNLFLLPLLLQWQAQK
ncbi:MAG: MMPL family transporter [Pirellulaceae bacterium]